MTRVSHSMTGNISLSGANRVTVPVTFDGSRHGTTGGSGSWGFVIVRTAVVGFPRSYDCVKILPSRWTSTVMLDASAFTTDTPTPWSPPVTLYPAPPNF